MTEKRRGLSPNRKLDKTQSTDNTSSRGQSSTSGKNHHRRMMAAEKYAQELKKDTSDKQQKMEISGKRKREIDNTAPPYRDLRPNDHYNILQEMKINCEKYNTSTAIVVSKFKVLDGMIRNYNEGKHVFLDESHLDYTHQEDHIKYNNKIMSTLTKPQANIITFAYEYIKDFMQLFDRGYKDWRKASDALDKVETASKSDIRSNQEESINLESNSKALSDIRYHTDWLEGINFAINRLYRPPILDNRNNLYTGNNKEVDISTFDHPDWKMRSKELDEIFKDPKTIFDNPSIAILADTRAGLKRIVKEMEEKNYSEGFKAGVERAKEIYSKAKGKSKRDNQTGNR